VVSGLLNGPAVAFAKTKAAINAATLIELEPTLQPNSGSSMLLQSHDLPRGRKAFQQLRTPDFTAAELTPFIRLRDRTAAATQSAPQGPTKWVRIGASNPAGGTALE